MPKKIVISNLGGPEVLNYIEYEIPKTLDENNIRIQQSSIGLNYIDTYHRSGVYPLPSSLPVCPGLEAAGVIINVGNKVTNFEIGDRVCYASTPLGAYCEVRDFPSSKAIKIPEGISEDTASSILLKGMTVEYLFEQLYHIKKNEYILFHAAAGGVGLIASQWARSIGCKMIGTVSNKEKGSLALDNGCSYAINYREENVVEKVKEAVGDFMDEASIESFAQLVWKYKLPVAAVVAVLYGGKKLKDYMAGEEEEAGNTTINNYYGTDSEPATEDTNRLRKLAGITEKTSDVYTTELGNVTAHSLTMHGLLDQIEDYYHNKHDSDEMDIQIGDDTVWLGDEQFSIEKNGEELGSDLGNELEREDISKGNGPYQHKLQGDDLERSKTMTPDEIKVLAGVTEEELNEYGTIDTARPSRATARADRTHYKVSSRRANNIAQDQNRDASVPNRTVAGGNKQPTGQGAARAGSADPDDIERAHNANVSSSNQEQANVNAQEIERLKQLAMGG